LGQFISPDTLVPDPTNVMDYNRYAYARGNPLKYNDPTGHGPCPACPTIIIINGIDQTAGVPATNSVDLAQNLAEWGHTNTYLAEIIYTRGRLQDAWDVAAQNRENFSGGIVEETTGKLIDRLEQDRSAGAVTLDPAQGVVIIGHSGGGPVAIAVGQYIHNELNVPVKGIVAIGSPLFRTRLAAEVADVTVMMSFADDPFGTFGVNSEMSDPMVIWDVTFGAPIYILPMMEPPRSNSGKPSHNLYGQSDEVVRTMKRFIPDLFYLRDPGLIEGMQRER
jgi:pimeloyl-ACP methyl ester carboxylesterase